MSAYHLQYDIMESPLSEENDTFYEYEYAYEYDQPVATVYAGNVMHQRMMLILITVAFVVGMGVWLNGRRGTPVMMSQGGKEQEQTAVKEIPRSSNISPLFDKAVRYWEPQILIWAAQYNLDPNIVATIMQIESCGDPQAVSSAGAQGLFQVMPGHFGAGEDMLDPDTNAMRGLNYYAAGLEYHHGDIYLSFAGYNGGHGTVTHTYASWPNETQRYYYWSKGIYDELPSGSSPTLNEWLQAGGAGLCQQAAARLGI